ncbi:MAG TPA: hypothetical protein VGN17_26830 [Bryobacteraceae bacterium]|jgi:uncharacterized protein (TIGR03437 family)
MRILSGIFLLVLVKGNPLAAETTISTVAGGSWVGDNGLAISAILLQAEGVAADSKGNLYIADASDHRVRRIAPNGLITTVAGTGARGFSGDGGPAAAAQLNSPYGIAIDGRGDVYVADLGNGRVREITADGNISTVAGGGTLPAGGPNEGSAATMVALTTPRNVALDSFGNLYISDFGGNRVYRVARDGSLTTAAGNGTPGAAGDNNLAIAAQLNSPAGLAVDTQGSLYIADSGNHLVRRVSSGIIHSYARAATPTGLVLDALGTLYIADSSAGQIVRVPQTGSATAIDVSARDVAFGPDGSLYASNGISVMRVSPQGAILKIAGGGDLGYGDNGAATQARLNHPAGVAMDLEGNLYIADRDNHRVRKVTPGGIISTIAGTGIAGDSGDGGAAVFAQINSPNSVAIDHSGTLYIADTGNHRVRKVTTDGKISAATNGGLLSPVYVLPDNAGDIYIADSTAGRVLFAGSNGVPATLAQNLKSPRGLALDPSGNLYIAESGGAAIRRMGRDGSLSSLSGPWQIPRGVAVDGQGNISVADTGLQRILEVDTTGKVTVMAGTGTAGFSGDNGPAEQAQLGYPWDVAPGPNGVTAIADLDNNRIRLVTPPPTAVVPASGSAPLPSNLSTLPALLNAASLQPGPAAPEMMMLLRNTGIDPTQIASTQILFGPALARILSADANGILLVAPFEIAGTGTASVEIFYKGVLQATLQVPVAEAAPALFADATGQITATNQDGSINSGTNPAPRGSVVSLYGTGLGIPGASVSVSVATFPAEVLYAGPVAGYAGLSQINVEIPTGYLPSGQLAVSVVAAGSVSQPGLFLTVN